MGSGSLLFFRLYIIFFWQLYKIGAVSLAGSVRESQGVTFNKGLTSQESNQELRINKLTSFAFICLFLKLYPALNFRCVN